MNNAALFLLTLPSVISVSILDFSKWTSSYGAVSNTSPTSVSIPYIESSGGSQISGPAQLAGTFCMNVKPPFKSGVALTMSLYGVGHHEKSLETVWYYNQEYFNKVTYNVWDNAEVNLLQNTTYNIPNSINAYYCMTWKVGGFADFYIDGQLIVKQSIATYTQPLSPTIVIWGGLTVPWFVSLGGAYAPAPGVTTSATITNGYLSTAQEIGPVTQSPTLSPTAAPTSTPSAPSSAPSLNPTVSTSNPSVAPVSVPTVPTAAPSLIDLSNSEGSTSSSPLGAIIGGIIAGLVVFFLLAAFVYYHYNKEWDKTGSPLESKGDEAWREVSRVSMSTLFPKGEVLGKWGGENLSQSRLSPSAKPLKSQLEPSKDSLVQYDQA